MSKPTRNKNRRIWIRKSLIVTEDGGVEDIVHHHGGHRETDDRAPVWVGGGERHAAHNAGATLHIADVRQCGQMF